MSHEAFRLRLLQYALRFSVSLSLSPLGPSRRGPWELGCLNQCWHVVKLNQLSTTQSFSEAPVSFLVMQKGLLTNSGED